jgi:hypothetical protein
MHLHAGRISAWFFAASLIAPASAQTLRQRPPAQPVKPAAPLAPAPKPPPKPVLPKGTSLQVEIDRHYPMKAGETIEGSLMHPIYWNGKLAIPEHTLLRGQVVSLLPNKKERWHGRLNGDFTPYHTPEVRFSEFLLPGGPLPISAAVAADGAPVLRLTAKGVSSKKRAFIAQHWQQAKAQLHDRIAFFTAPGKGDRLLQMLYRQLPYHPERIEAHTAWSFELAAPVDLPKLPQVAPARPAPTVTSATGRELWAIHAQLMTAVTSATARPGDPVNALVVEPVYDKAHQLVVPQGAMLIGRVTTAKAARSLGRNGKLRFSFQQVHMPAGATRQVEGSLGGASVDKSQNLSLDAEGTVTPGNKGSAVAPLLLTLMAGRALDTDGSMAANNTVASNGFGVIGRVVGIVAGDPALAAGLGYYAAGLSVYDNFLHGGRNVIFAKDTRIEIETVPLNAQVLSSQDGESAAPRAAAVVRAGS